MDEESRSHDFKLTFDPTDEKAKIDLVKNLVAMANAGGGSITFGCTETDVRGLDPLVLKALDSARLTDLVNRFTPPNSVVLSHEVIVQEDSDRIIVRVNVEVVPYPVVMTKKGDWKGMQTQKGDRPLFVEGDIWTRHSSKTERVTYEDLRSWIDRARSDERDRMLRNLEKLVQLPEGAEVKVVLPSEIEINTPESILKYATQHRAVNRNYLLSPSALLEVFLLRSTLQPAPEEIALLIASALRRTATLYWWVTLANDSPALILQELESCLIGSDRDKSDAGRMVVELAAIYADDAQFTDLQQRLSESTYKHFREAAGACQSRTAMLQQLRKRIERSKHDGRLLLSYTVEELEQLATDTATQLMQTPSSGASRKLGDITRAIWYKRK
jgi:hypothetical protein